MQNSSNFAVIIMQNFLLDFNVIMQNSSNFAVIIMQNSSNFAVIIMQNSLSNFNFTVIFYNIQSGDWKSTFHPIASLLL